MGADPASNQGPVRGEGRGKGEERVRVRVRVRERDGGMRYGLSWWRSRPRPGVETARDADELPLQLEAPQLREDIRGRRAEPLCDPVGVPGVLLREELAEG